MADSVKIQDTWFEPYITQDQLTNRISAVAELINQDYAGIRPVFIGVLKGAVFFCTDLVRQFKYECELDFIKVQSYDKMTSTGEVHELMGLSTDIKGRHVVLLEDIVDTGLTLQSVVNTLQSLQPASIQIAAMTIKPDALEEKVEVPYVGFELPNEFVVGFGLDYDQLGRNLEAIYKRKSETYD